VKDGGMSATPGSEDDTRPSALSPQSSYTPIWDPDAAGPCEAGIDAIEPARIAALIARRGERFLGRVFTPAERAICRERPASLAARYAAKEAVSKALGTGIGLVAWREIEILENELGRPVLVLHGAAAARAAHLGLRHWSVSLTHLADVALAMVVASAERGVPSGREHLRSTE